MKIKAKKCNCQSRKYKELLNSQNTGPDKHGFHNLDCAKREWLVNQIKSLSTEAEFNPNIGEIEVALFTLAYALSESR
jgi:hypothetical protein